MPETLEELFYSKEDLAGYDIVKWLRHKNPEAPQKEVFEHATVLQAVYEGWKAGQFFTEGDTIGLREWSRN